MAKAMIRRLVIMLVVAGALCVPATTAQAQASSGPELPPGVGVRLLEGPPSSVNDPRARSYIIDHLAPGTTITRQIGFSNGNTEPIQLSFYATAASIDGGTFEVGPGRTANELTAWTTFSPPTAVVKPGETFPVTVTIAVPADAARGERYAAALAELIEPASGSGGITSVSRVGIRLYLSIGSGGAPRTAFTIDSMTAARDADGNPMVTVSVHNTGERAIDLSGELHLTNGPSSLSAGPFPVRTVATLGPDQTGAVTIVLDPELPAGPWDARITLTSGVTTEEGTATLTFPAGDDLSAAPTPVVSINSGWSPLWVVAIASTVGLVALGALGYHRMLRRRRQLVG